MRLGEPTFEKKKTRSFWHLLSPPVLNSSTATPFEKENPDSSGFGNFLGLVQFAFGSESVDQKISLLPLV